MIVCLTGETNDDLRLLEKGDVIVCMPTQVCLLSYGLASRSHRNLSLVGCSFQKIGGGYPGRGGQGVCARGDAEGEDEQSVGLMGDLQE